MAITCSCGLILRHPGDYNTHVAGKRHAATMSGAKPFRRVRKTFPVNEEAEQSARMAQTSSRRAPGVFPVIEEVEPDVVPESHLSSYSRCPHCGKDIVHWKFRDHVVAHDLQERLNSALQEAQRNKRGITVDGLDCVDFGIVGEKETPSVPLVIARESELSPPPPLFLAKLRLLSSSRDDEHGDR